MRMSAFCAYQVLRGWRQKYHTYLVTRIKILPRSLPNFSFADSDAEVEQAGYSPPTPTPAIPLATVLMYISKGISEPDMVE